MNNIDTSRLERIAFASSKFRDNDLPERWTELAIYYRPGERRPFVAESVGATRVEGEREFRRQRVAASIEKAGQLFESSRLSDEIDEQAQAWLNAHPEAEARPAPVIAFDGAGGLLGALRWLYGDDLSEGALSGAFEADWGVPARTVRHALANEKTPNGLPSWCKAWLGALQHFDRDAFLASRRVDHAAA